MAEQLLSVATIERTGTISRIGSKWLRRTLLLFALDCHTDQQGIGLLCRPHERLHGRQRRSILIHPRPPLD